MTFNINQQIEEVERELRERDGVYARLVASGRLRQSLADYQKGRMMAVLNTLKWLRDNEDAIKHRLAS